MIGSVAGVLIDRGLDSCLVEVNGIGCRLHCSAATLASLPPEGEQCRLWTHLHVREDVLALYGFTNEAEQKMFEAMLGVSGVGPKVALQICSAFTPEAFRKSLVTDDVAAFSSVPGVGKKTAQRILLDLKEKLDLPDLALVGSQPDALAGARSALENLGYSAGEVRVALGEIATNNDDDVEEVIRSALRVLAG